MKSVDTNFDLILSRQRGCREQEIEQLIRWRVVHSNVVSNVSSNSSESLSIGYRYSS